jgi:uncharacterized protein YjbJ (UPF0337 family)
MNSDHIKGTAHEVKGATKEATGKITGDSKTELEGKVEKKVGKAQKAVGNAKDAVRDAHKH